MVGTPINQGLINQGLIKDLISPLLSVDLLNSKRAGKKGGSKSDCCTCLVLPCNSSACKLSSLWLDQSSE